MVTSVGAIIRWPNPRMKNFPIYALSITLLVILPLVRYVMSLSLCHGNCDIEHNLIFMGSVWLMKRRFGLIFAG